MNVEGKLKKVLGKDQGTLVVTASQRDAVLQEIDARIARYERFDKDTAAELRDLRGAVRDVFNKGTDPGLDMMEHLYFLTPETRDFLEKMTRHYDRVVTPDDFKAVAGIMSDHLREQVPILKDFTRFFGRLAEDYLKSAKPSSSALDWKVIAKTTVMGSKRKGYTVPDSVARLLGLTPGKPLSRELLERANWWTPGGTLAELLGGVEAATDRRTGFKMMRLSFKVPTIDLKKAALGKTVKVTEVEVLHPNKLPKSWTNVPWANFDGRIIEQNFTQSFEERLSYKDADGNWVNNILQVPQRTSASWWDEIANESGKMNDIADVTKARTAFAVNGNHSNDAVIVKKFHLWGKKNGVRTSTVHDAFFTNAADMLKARSALREIYAEALKNNVIKMTLEEMRRRGLPKELYDRYMEEAIAIGLIPVPGVSRVGGKILTIEDILTEADIKQAIPEGFTNDKGWYGVG